MKRTILVIVATVAIAASQAAPSAVAQEGFKIVVAPSSGVSTLTRDDASRVFLKKIKRWAAGQAIQPVDQKAGSPLREAFTQAIHGRALSAITAYWQTQIFSGRSLPPVVKSSDAEVIGFVRSTPGGIGYVSSGTPTGGLKVVAIE